MKQKERRKDKANKVHKAQEKNEAARLRGEEPNTPCGKCNGFHWEVDCPVIQLVNNQGDIDTTMAEDGNVDPPSAPAMEAPRPQTPPAADDATVPASRKRGASDGHVMPTPRRDPAKKKRKQKPSTVDNLADQMDRSSLTSSSPAPSIVVRPPPKAAAKVVPTKRHKKGDEVELPGGQAILYLKMPDSLTGENQPGNPMVINALLESGVLDVGEFTAVAPRDKSGWTVEVNNESTVLRAVGKTFLMKDKAGVNHEIPISQFHISGPQFFTAVNKGGHKFYEIACAITGIIGKQVKDQSLPSGLKFWMGRYICHGVKDYNVVVVFDKVPGAKSFTIPLPPSLSNPTTPATLAFRAGNVSQGCAYCRVEPTDHTALRCVHLRPVHFTGQQALESTIGELPRM